jgi:hypothetical protein
MPLSANIVVARPEDAATLRTLEAKGFVRREHARWQPVHDVVVESLLADSATADVAAAHRQLTEALVRTRAPEHLPMAVRHFCAAGADDEAGNLFVQVVAQARARGDRRPATQLLTDIVGAAVSPERQQTIVQRVRWHQRQPGAFARLWFGLSLVTSVAAATFAWASARKPSLNLSQAALVAHGAPLFGTRALRLVPSIVVRVGNGRSADTGARVVQVRPLDSDVTILAGDRVTAERGLARFGGLRLASSDSVIRLRFESPGYRPVDAEVRVNTGGGPAPGDDGIHLVEGRFTVGGIRQTVRGPDALLRVPADSLLNGAVHADMIWEVFARRGLGADAIQGEANLLDDGVAGFKLPSQVMRASETAGLEGFHLFPQPASDLLNLAFPRHAESFNLYLYDGTGRTLRSFSIPAGISARISLEGLKPGCYFLGTGNGAARRVLKF